MKPIGKARLFGIGSPPAGEDAQVSILDDRMEVRTSSRVLAPLLAELRLREVGATSERLEFSWSSGDGLHALQVSDADALQALRADPLFQASPQMAALREVRRRGSALRAVGWTMLALAVVLPVLLIVLFLWKAEAIALAVAERIPIEQEVSLGEQAFAAMRGSLQFQQNGPAYDAVQTLGQRLTQGSKYRYQFHVVKDPAINAFAMPGGIVVVNSGLIEATRRAEELAGVLAHEVQHVEQRHSLQAVIKDLGLRGLWLLATGDIGSGLTGRAILELQTLSFSRDAELQADAVGFGKLVDAGIDPSGMSDFFTVLAKEEAGKAPPPLLSTHPASAAREAALRAREKDLGGRRFDPLKLGKWPPLQP
jgi:Zn-dependent protease with chaperone function